MKNFFSKNRKSAIAISALSVLLIASSFSKPKPVAKPATDDLEGTISISGAFALYPITVKWASEFKKLHPKVTFNISAGGAGKGITDALSGLVDIGLASRDIDPSEVKKVPTPYMLLKMPLYLLLIPLTLMPQHCWRKVLKEPSSSTYSLPVVLLIGTR